ncbi:MAG: [Fe-Fe] hydrogenase large subunit C-terminal domain-containing protein, partial [Thermodesulfobacteriota bacterium]
PEVRTAISPSCPVVLRLISKRFPELIPNIIPVAPPREVAAKHIRRLLMRRLKVEDEDIGLFHVTHCAANIAAINHPLTVQTSFLDGCLGLHDLFGGVLRNLKKLTEEDREKMLFKAGGAGIGWGLGREQPGVNLGEGRSLYVSGLAETIEVLDQISAGRLAGFRYIECLTCPDGCLGGPLTVDNRFMARATLNKLLQMFGTVTRVRPVDIAPYMAQGFFLTDKEIRPQLIHVDDDPLVAMKKMKRMNKLAARLSGRLCGACGAPDCRTLAEDVVLGRASLDDCPFYEGDEPGGEG